MQQEIAKILQLEHNCRLAEDESELYYTIVNKTRTLVEYDQAILLTNNINNKLIAKAISDISIVDSTAPFVHYIEELSNYIKKTNLL
jgi:hypothetical protein